ncbi:hypothetical protein H2203_007647 [Taxawa tesnikishii (nom. ined.)]|nr:hypothetical protein H2203_007647 [Dothideales sp. JES 119]
MPPIIRRAPLGERIKAYLNPYDFLLWLSEELHESALDEALQGWAPAIGLGANLLFMIARANSGASFITHFLALLAVLNALYTFTRTRKYRLFESSVEKPPSTPSAHRVKIDSSPLQSTPLRYVNAILNANSAASRAYPDEHNDVWEIHLWDPKELNLELFTFFSPGHMLVYWIFLPTAALDPRPSVTVFTSILLGTLMTLQLSVLCRFFTQQAKDSAVIHKEVMNEYDTKFVHPAMNRPVRDVATQTIQSATSPRARTREVDVYTPTTIVNRGFKVNPNPNYASHLGTDLSGLYAETPTRRVLRNPVPTNLKSPAPATNGGMNGYTSFAAQTDRVADFSSPLKARDRSPVKGDGGSLGVYTHAASPLRTSKSSGFLRPGGDDGRTRGGSPLKRMSTPGGGGNDLSQRFAGLRDGRDARRDTTGSFRSFGA